MEAITSYELQQGFENPREPGALVYTNGEEFLWLEEAEAAAEKLKTKWRIISHTIELTSEDDE
jgi:hypothetical protein